MKEVAWFITPHGFGHASRECAVISALRDLIPDCHFHVYTTVPRWFFQDSLGGGFTYHELETDVGIVQHGPFEEDFPATLRKLSSFLPISEGSAPDAVRELVENRVRLVVCDISPLGIELARLAGIRSLLIENFTWSWIYSGYASRYPELNPAIDELRKIESRADYRFQTEPVRGRLPQLPLFAPAARHPRKSRAQVRGSLGISSSDACVLVTTGGIPFAAGGWKGVHFPTGIRLIMPGTVEKLTRSGSAIFLPHHSDFYHPDLVNACDAVVGKVGYSTLAETYRAGLPFGFINRPGFPESPVLARYIRERMSGREISLEDFLSGSWVEDLPSLLRLPRRPPAEENGAALMASRIQELL